MVPRRAVRVQPRSSLTLFTTQPFTHPHTLSLNSITYQPWAVVEQHHPADAGTSVSSFPFPPPPSCSSSPPPLDTVSWLTTDPRSKFKPSRGGGRHFSRDVTMKAYGRNPEASESESEEEEDESEEEEEEQVALTPAMAALNLKLGNTEEVAQPEEEEMSRADRKALKKKQAEEAAKKKGTAGPKDGSEESEDELLNPFKAKKVEPSRKER